MENQEILDKFIQMSASMTKAGLHAIFPNDFEYYFTALELEDARGKIVEYLVFPVSPSNIKETPANPANIKKAAGSTTVLINPNFVPFPISVSGNFGRGFKVLLGGDFITSTEKSTSGGVYRANAFSFSQAYQIFNPKIKTGYGCIKILESIFYKAKSLDSSGLPYKLYFHNLALGNSYIVIASSLDLSQDMQSNAIWNYQISMQALALTSDLKKISKKSLIKRLAAAELQKSTTALLNRTKSKVYLAPK